MEIRAESTLDQIRHTSSMADWTKDEFLGMWFLLVDERTRKSVSQVARFMGRADDSIYLELWEWRSFNVPGVGSRRLLSAKQTLRRRRTREEPIRDFPTGDCDLTTRDLFTYNKLKLSAETGVFKFTMREWGRMYVHPWHGQNNRLVIPAGHVDDDNPSSAKIDVPFLVCADLLQKFCPTLHKKWFADWIVKNY